MSYNDYVPFSSQTSLPSNDKMDQMLLQEQIKGHQRLFQSGLEHRINNIEAKLDMLATILFENRAILKGGMLPDLGAGHKPPPVKNMSFEDKLKQKDEQDRQVAEQGVDSMIPIESREAAKI